MIRYAYVCTYCIRACYSLLYTIVYYCNSPHIFFYFQRTINFIYFLLLMNMYSYFFFSRYIYLRDHCSLSQFFRGNLKHDILATRSATCISSVIPSIEQTKERLLIGKQLTTVSCRGRSYQVTSVFLASLTVSRVIAYTSYERSYFCGSKSIPRQNDIPMKDRLSRRTFCPDDIFSEQIVVIDAWSCRPRPWCEKRDLVSSDAAAATRNFRRAYTRFGRRQFAITHTATNRSLWGGIARTKGKR